MCFQSEKIAGRSLSSEFVNNNPPENNGKNKLPKIKSSIIICCFNGEKINYLRAVLLVVMPPK